MTSPNFGEKPLDFEESRGARVLTVKSGSGARLPRVLRWL